ncbi:hypothetical protein ACJ41O_015089 [Fusarium nematophilum]
MAPIELDAPEIEALVDIRQKLTPLISKRIACGRDQVTNLAVLNARDAMSFELDQVFLHLRKDQDMGLEDYKQFLRDLQELKLLLEGFIDEQVLTLGGNDHSYSSTHEEQVSSVDQERDTSDEDGFPKLKALMRRATEDQDGSDLSLFINLPDTNEESLKAEQAVTRFNTSNSKRCDKKDTDNYQTEADAWHQRAPYTATDETSTSTSHEPLRNLVTTLRENIEARACDHQHVAKIQVREPTWNPEISEGLDHNLFLSCSLVEGKWQQTTCRVVTKPPRATPPLKRMKHACKTIQGCLDDEETLTVFLHRDCLLWNPDCSTTIQSPPIWPTLSLAEMLKSDLDPLRPYDKVILALNLSRMLLRMYGMGMDGCAWSAEDLFFLFESSQQTAYEIYNPYLDYSITGTGRAIGPTSPRKFPILIAFAKLLLEIACGKVLGPFERRPDRPEISLLAELEKGTVTEDVVAAYVYAIRKCLKANKDDDEDAGSEEEQCRAVIREAVADLEEAWSTAYATKGDLNSPKTLKVPRTVLERQSPANSQNGPTKMLQEPRPAAVGEQTASLPNGLFDVTRLKVPACYMDSRCTWANDFLGRADDFYMQHIEHLPSDKRIRVAILDTGIDDTNIFFRAAKRSRRRRDSPIMMRESFLAGTAATDTDGHGTNVAALVLKMAPEADLYVGKISSGHEAIRWAIDLNVHIINMSFGISNASEEIRGAIRDAEAAGIICTIAASNYGSNEMRSFPAKLDQVLCIHAGDGNGNKSGLNPTPLRWRDNLSTLGVCIPSEWRGEEDHYVSGTSYAAPVAAGIAANVLRFVQWATDEGFMTQPQRMNAYSCAGMRHIMLAMCEPRDGYDFVMPWRRMWSEGSTERDVISKMKEALKNV